MLYNTQSFTFDMMDSWIWIVIPLISGLIGWLTNKLAIWMLFYPEKPFNLLFFKLQGVFPKRQSLIADKIGEMVSSYLLSPQDLKEHVFTPTNINEVRVFVEGKLNEYFDHNFQEKYPWLSLFIGRKSKDKIKIEVLEQLDKSIQDLDENLPYYLEKRVDIKEIISQKINSLESKEVNHLMQKVLHSELAFIEWIGAIIGFIIGLLQCVLFSIT